MADLTGLTEVPGLRRDHDHDHDVVIVGAGFAGLYALHRMRGLGFSARVFERGEGIGGTWFWNRYPGARCDVPSMQYSYSFDRELEREWEWTERYPAQPEILRYLNHVADRFDLRRDIELNTAVVAAHYDETGGRWTLRLGDGRTVSARYCLMAVGCLSSVHRPAIPGLERFRGKWYHTARWPRAGVDFTGRRVGVVGTGSTGIQAIPRIAEQAARLYVFQRTPNFSMPAHNAPLDPGEQAQIKADYPRLRQACRESPIGIAGPIATLSSSDVTDEERTRAFEAGWARGGAGAVVSAFTDIRLDLHANDLAADFVRRKIAQIVRDPDVARLLMPHDHPIGSKRVCVDTDYYETYNRDNVTLVDVRTHPIEEVTERGVRTAAAEYNLDALVFATGFDAITGALREIDIRGRGGLALAEKWAAGPRTYLGLATAGFPNLFLITGPGSPSVLSNMVISIEQHVDWIADCLEDLREHGHDRIEADPAAEDAWVDHVAELAGATFFPLANSWYVGANIPGKPRVFSPYVGGVGTYRKICAEIAADGYRGFVRAVAPSGGPARAPRRAARSGATGP